MPFFNNTIQFLQSVQSQASNLQPVYWSVNYSSTLSFFPPLVVQLRNVDTEAQNINANIVQVAQNLSKLAAQGLALLQPVTLAIQTYFTNAQASLHDLQVAIVSTGQLTAADQATVNGLNASNQALVTQLNTLQPGLSSIVADANALNSQLAGIATTITGLQTDLSTLPAGYGYNSSSGLAETSVPVSFGSLGTLHIPNPFHYAIGGMYNVGANAWQQAAVNMSSGLNTLHNNVSILQNQAGCFGNYCNIQMQVAYLQNVLAGVGKILTLLSSDLAAANANIPEVMSVINLCQSQIHTFVYSNML